MIHIRKLLVCLVMVLFSINCALAQELTESTSKKHQDVTYLFIEVASGAKLQKINTSGNYLLTLNGVEPWVTYFSNVPVRVTGFMSVENFNKIMNRAVNEFYPKGLNSGLIALDKDKNTLRYTFSLSEPKYSLKNKTIIFKAKVVPGNQTDPLPETASYKHIALFIDGVCISCGGSGF